MAIFREFSQLAGPAAVRGLWQGAVVAGFLLAGLRFAPRIAAADRFRIWLAAFAVVVALPFLPLLGWFHAATPGMAGIATASAPQPWVNLDGRWSLAIAALWLALAAWRTAALGAHSLRLRRLWKHAVPLEIGGTEYAVCATRELDRPSVIGFFAPRILVPDWLLERLSREELEQVILHESEHLRRHDDWTNLLQKMALVLFPLNPALLWVEQRLCREREMACDEGVVRRTRAPRAYAACLTSLAERGLERRAEALSLGAWQRRPELVERVHRILRRGPGMRPAAARALLMAMGCGLVAGSVEFARCPQLVGFSEPQPQAQLARGDAADKVVNPAAGPAVARVLTTAQAGEGYRAVAAMARVPSQAEQATARRQRGDAAAQSRTASAQARKSNPDAVQQAAATEGRSLPGIAGEVPQQWMVVTTWEQIETGSAPARRGPRSGSRATAAASTVASGTPGDAVLPATRQITVTQLYLTVYPAAASKPAHGASKSSSPSPQLLPLQGGWLFLQL